MNAINLTPSAMSYLLSACKRAAKPAIMLKVKGGGCAGFSYEYEYTDTSPSSEDVVVPLDETYSFIVDGMSLMFVLGTTLDYEEKLGQSALVLKNPNEVSSCGCGKSFAV